MKLESGNMIERCHGGAVAKQEIAYETKQTSNKNSKEAIARKCVEFVHPQDSVFLDADDNLRDRKINPGHPRYYHCDK